MEYNSTEIGTWEFVQFLIKLKRKRAINPTGFGWSIGPVGDEYGPSYVTIDFLGHPLLSIRRFYSVVGVCFDKILHVPLGRKPLVRVVPSENENQERNVFYIPALYPVIVQNYQLLMDESVRLKIDYGSEWPEVYKGARVLSHNLDWESDLGDILENVLGPYIGRSIQIHDVGDQCADELAEVIMHHRKPSGYL